MSERMEGVVVNISKAGSAFVSARGGERATHFAHKYGLEKCGLDYVREGERISFTEAPPGREGGLPLCYDIEMA